MIKWIIFYVALSGGGSEYPMGEVLFFKGDSLKIFDMIWQIKRMDAIDDHADKLYHGIFDLQHKEINAHMSIVYRDVIFKIESRNENETPIIITFKQRDHYKFLYEDIEEEYKIEKKDTDQETRKDRRKRKEKYDGIQQIVSN